MPPLPPSVPHPSTFLPVRSSVDVGVVEAISSSTVCGCCFETLSSEQTKWCAGCRAVAYCSPSCQREHWKHGGHKAACEDARTVKQGDKAFAKTMATLGGVGVAEPKHPCPACRVNECDATTLAGDPALCTYCGVTWCGDCLDAAYNAGFCDTCEQPFNVSDEEDLARLHRLHRRIGEQPPPNFDLGNVAFALAQYYRKGVGTPRDIFKCTEYLKEAMKHGITRSYSSLALRMNELAACDMSYTFDPEEHTRLIRLGAESGCIAACANYGCTLFRGVGTEANLAEAERWWRAAAWKNVPGACFELANALYIGWIAPPPSAAAFPDCTTRGIVRNWTETDRLLRKVLASGAPMNPTYEVNLTAGQILRRLLCTRGHIVRIHGLVQTPEFNGVLAEVQSTTSGSDAVLSDLPERIHVRPLLISGGASGVKAIRPSNLVAIAPRRPWAEPWAEIDFVADESGYDPAAAAYVWEYASGEDGNIVWCRYPPRIEKGIEDMFNVSLPSFGADQVEEMFHGVNLQDPAYPTLRKIREQMINSGKKEARSPHFLFRPGHPECEGRFEWPLSIQPPAGGGQIFSTRRVWFNQRDLVGAYELDMYTGARRAVRRRRNRDK